MYGGSNAGRHRVVYSVRRFAPVARSGFGGPTPHRAELKAIDSLPALTLTTQLVTAALTETPDVTDATNQGWNLQLLNGCVQGTTLYQRVGQKIVMKKLVAKLIISGCLDANAGQANNPGMVRVMFVYDAQPNGTVLTAANLAAAVLKTNTTICALQNLDNRERFRILGDKFYYIGAADYISSGSIISQNTGSEQFMKLCKKFKAKVDLDTCYNAGNAGSIADIQSGALYLLCGVGGGFNTDGTGKKAFVVAGQCRVRFYDS